MKKPMPLSHVPTRAATSDILGLGNNINNITKDLTQPLEMHVPDWSKGGKIRSNESVLAIANRKRNSIKQGSKNTYRKNNTQASRVGAAARTTMTGHGAAGGRNVI